MQFEKTLTVERAAVLQAMGYGEVPADAATAERLEAACRQVEAAVQARYVWRAYQLKHPPCLPQAGLALVGTDIAAHLAGCDACALLALTLGEAVERAIRAAEATDMALAVLMDAAASMLVEGYADAASAVIAKAASEENRYTTPRFSPGYGDLPLSVNHEVLALLQAGKAIGLTLAPSGLMLPRKSITAVVGLAAQPVAGRLAGCQNCTLREKCGLRKEGKHCGKSTV